MATSASAIDAILGGVPLPAVVAVHASSKLPHSPDPACAASDALARGGYADLVRPDSRVAIGVGSRGIASLPSVVSATVAAVRSAGGDPVIVPAMGSHGGATAEGQQQVLAALGVTEESVGASIDSDMAVEELGRVRVGDRDVPVYCARSALRADATLLVARVKPHTSFRARYESGLVKMAAIGLGKQAGAEACHARGYEQLGDAVSAVGMAVLANANVVAGLAVLENANHQVAELELVATPDIGAREPELLARAWELYPALPVDALDVMVLDEIGKDIAGTGFDTNVVGRYPQQSMRPTSARRCVSRLVALGLSAATGGNANGMGMVDVATRRLFDRLSFGETYPNALTSTNTTMSKVPMIMDNDRLALQAAIYTSQARGPIRMARARNTLQLTSLEVSEPVAEELSKHEEIELGPPKPLRFDDSDNLAPVGVLSSPPTD